VRYIANRSSGKQGHAIAAAMARMGAETVLVTGPTQEFDPPGVAVIHVETAQQMLDACQTSLPADVAVCAAAVSDWRPKSAGNQKIKKNGAPPKLTLAENPDILKTLATAGNERPRLVIGFAAETGNVIAKAKPKLLAKGCDWIVANDVAPGTQTFGGSDNTVHLITADDVESWPRMSKMAVADQLASRIADTIAPRTGQ
jgi:phosphopantothenoylcysteine decarboxylase/phosphopantothenate--cysteine ligase